MHDLPAKNLLPSPHERKTIPRDRNEQSEKHSFVKTKPGHHIQSSCQYKKDAYDHSRKKQTHRPFGQDTDSKKKIENITAGGPQQRTVVEKIEDHQRQGHEKSESHIHPRTDSLALVSE